ncbi:MAG: glycosyltransferase family 4 protein [Gemmataceae bacterium]|nr:glycosyltransferase family 4 protein [Gemmataceae bacterium]
MSFFRGASRALPYYRSTYTRPAVVLAAFRHTIDDLPPAARRRVVQFPEVGFDPATFHPGPARPPADRVTFLFAGRLVPYKCADVLVEAFARTPALRRHRLWVVGDGPERPALEAAVRAHGLEGCVELLGWKTQAEVGDLLRRADVFAFPSIRELGAGIVVEAMACGLACLVVDYGGPGGLVREGVGERVRLQPKDDMIREFAGRMLALAGDPARTREMGRAAAAYARDEYSWGRRADKLRGVYEWAVARSGAKPAPYGPG